MLDESFNKHMLNEGKHWPADYIKTAINAIKASKLGHTTWYNDNFIKKDVETFVDGFRPLSHKNSNLGFFMVIIKWFIEYSGDDKNRYQEFIEHKLDTIIKTLLKICNDISYDSKIDTIKKMKFLDFEKLADQINSQAPAKLNIKNNNGTYNIIPIFSYEELNEKYGGDKTGYKGNSEWCHTNGVSTYESWTSNGTRMFFVIEREDWKKIQPPNPYEYVNDDYEYADNHKNAYDEYGMSLIAILVNVADNRLIHSTLRWNHIILPSSGAADSAFDDWSELNSAIGIDVENICRKATTNLDEIIKQKNKQYSEKFTNYLKTIGDTITSDNLVNARDIAKHMVKMIIPDNITTIDAHAFNHTAFNNIKYVEIPDSVLTIRQYAFTLMQNLIKVKLSNRLTTIEKSLFFGTSLSSIDMPDTIESIGDKAFACSNISNIKLSNNLKSIGSQAFSDCDNLKSIDIPGSVEEIGSYAFSGSGISKIEIPKNVKYIKTKTFLSSNLKEIILHNGLKAIGNRAFKLCQQLTHIEIPDTVESIEERAFIQCTQLESIKLSKSLKTIKEFTFYQTGLTNIVIPDGVETIEDEAFGDCEQLTEVILPISIKRISDRFVFSGCYALKSIVFVGKTLDEVKSMDGYPWNLSVNQIKVQ